MTKPRTPRKAKTPPARPPHRNPHALITPPPAPRNDSTFDTPSAATDTPASAAPQPAIAFRIGGVGEVERVHPVTLDPLPPASTNAVTLDLDPTSSAAILGVPAVEIAPPPSTLLAPADVPVEIAGLGGVIVQSVNLDTYLPDERNANKGSDRSRAIIRRSIDEDGVGRSVFVGKKRKLIAGNQTVREARAAGIKRAIEITIPRDVLAVVRREDVDEDSEKGRRMAYADNRSRDHSLWDSGIVAADYDAGLIDELLFRPDEMDALFASLSADIDIQNAAATAARDGEKTRKLKQDKKQQVKAALYMQHLATFEQAIAATGIDQRAEAVATICRFYLDHAQRREAAPVSSSRLD